MSLPGEVQRFWTQLGCSKQPAVVAVSGGPDSVALLRAVAVVHTGPLIVAHLNHQLRGPDSDTDEAFVRDLHTDFRGAGHGFLELCSARIDVAARAHAEHDNLESVARRIRYEWLTGIARERHARWVATGHTADDQAETVLHRLLRGTGLKGLIGVPARRRLAPGIDVVRPMLKVTRAEVLTYLQVEGQAFREDRSNLDLRFTRNRIRHTLLPMLAQEYNPSIVSVLGSLAEQAEDVYRDIEARSRALLGEVELPRIRDGLVFDRSRLTAEPRHLVREVLRLAWEREDWPMGEMTSEHWDRAAAVALSELPAVDLPGGIHVQARDRVIVLRSSSSCR
jgi:tRNA(Ile)-lysidine synthase